MRAAERLLVDGCRLYATRPTRGRTPDSYESFARGFLELNASMTLWEYARSGPTRLRAWTFGDCAIHQVEDGDEMVRASGTVTWTRVVRGVEVCTTEALTILCQVAPSFRAVRRVRPQLLFVSRDDRTA